jgi:hypothetical protein
LVKRIRAKARAFKVSASFGFAAIFAFISVSARSARISAVLNRST